MNEKLKAILIILAVVGLVVGVVGAAAYWVYSNSVQQAVTDYTIALTQSWNGRTVTLTAHLTNPGGVAVEGGTIQFGTGTDAASFAFLGQANTNAAGDATYSYTVATTGTYNHIARYQIP